MTSYSRAAPLRSLRPSNFFRDCVRAGGGLAPWKFERDDKEVKLRPRDSLGRAPGARPNSLHGVPGDVRQNTMRSRTFAIRLRTSNDALKPFNPSHEKCATPHMFHSARRSARAKYRRLAKSHGSPTREKALGDLTSQPDYLQFLGRKDRCHPTSKARWIISNLQQPLILGGPGSGLGRLLVARRCLSGRGDHRSIPVARRQPRQISVTLGRRGANEIDDECARLVLVRLGPRLVSTLR